MIKLYVHKFNLDLYTIFSEYNKQFKNRIVVNKLTPFWTGTPLDYE